MAAIVPHGFYRGATLAEMELELARYKAARGNAGNDISSASYGGDSFTYGRRRDVSLEEWGEEIVYALYLLGDTRFDTPNTNMGAARIL